MEILTKLSQKRRRAFLALDQQIQKIVTGMDEASRDRYLDACHEHRDGKGSGRRIWSTGYTPGSRKYPYG